MVGHKRENFCRKKFVTQNNWHPKNWKNTREYIEKTCNEHAKVVWLFSFLRN